MDIEPVEDPELVRDCVLDPAEEVCLLALDDELELDEMTGIELDIEVEPVDDPELLGDAVVDAVEELCLLELDDELPLTVEDENLPEVDDVVDALEEDGLDEDMEELELTVELILLDEELIALFVPTGTPPAVSVALGP